MSNYCIYGNILYYLFHNDGIFPSIINFLAASKIFSGSTLTLATPVYMAAMATALATLAGISAVSAPGNILIGLNSDSLILLAIA